MLRQSSQIAIPLPAPLSSREILLTPILIRVLALVAVMLLAQLG